MAGFDEADVVIAIGYDLVEHAPKHWNPRRDKKIVVHRLRAGRDRRVLHRPRSSWSATSTTCSRAWPRSAATSRTPAASQHLHDVVLGRFEAGKDDDAFPMQPPRALWEIRQALGRDDILISDVGLHKLWIGRMFPAHEPNTVLIANGLAGMGFALPGAIAAKLVHPDRKVVTVSGDGGFLMNCQELETAVRLKTPVVNVIWENQQFGSIVWKQDKKFGRHFGVDFTNPDFVKLAESFGMPAWRCDVDRRLRHAPAARADARRAVADRAADRLLDRRRDQRGARHRDGGDVMELANLAHLRRAPRPDGPRVRAPARRRARSPAPR